VCIASFESESTVSVTSNQTFHSVKSKENWNYPSLSMTPWRNVWVEYSSSSRCWLVVSFVSSCLYFHIHLDVAIKSKMTMILYPSCSLVILITAFISWPEQTFFSVQQCMLPHVCWQSGSLTSKSCHYGLHNSTKHLLQIKEEWLGLLYLARTVT
jgi:hypothetical protein